MLFEIFMYYFSLPAIQQIYNISTFGMTIYAKVEICS